MFIVSSNTSAATNQKPRRRVLVALFTVASLAIGGCAAFQPKTPEEAVTQRAQDRWDAMRADKFEKSYELTAPSFRAVKTYKAYREKYGAGELWVSAKVMDVKCASDTNCTAVVEIGVRNVTPISQPPVLTTSLREDWVMEDGNWYLLPNI